jgi:aromatic-L-amino-acid decarboxylase
MVGLPQGSGGFLSSGGSIANLSALVAARRDRLGDDVDRFRRGTIYVSSQVHHSAMKAATIAGFPDDAVRVVEVDDRFRLRTDHLEERLAEDRAAGLEPFFLVASAGTTNTGAVDPLPEMAEIAGREGLWFHVDAAYGGFFALTERGRRLLAGMERADTVTLDPHKGLFLPYGTGCLLARDVAALRRAHTVQADYMPEMQDSAERLDFSEISPELSRGARGLRVWLPWKLLGVEPFVRALDEKLDLARWLAERLEEIPGIELVARPQLSNLAFRLAAPGLIGDDDEQDDLNRRLLDAIHRRRRVFLSGARLQGRFALRISVLSFRTHRQHAERAIEDIRAAVAEVLSEVTA